ncbi:magnesium/cobalt transporter CorA [Aeoliella sp. SH292]|uniref:magnesium/cobalt transporter CorA n=1 Tax=Aeoliella sp. SH292 TaxID=3454464 RepID=UPI003F954742
MFFSLQRRPSRSGTPRIRRHTPPGASPGTIQPHPDAPAPRIHVIHYTAETIEEQDVADPLALKTYLSREGVTWINVDGVGDPQMLEQIAQVFGLHALAMEDVVNVHQRAKVDEYDDHLFIVVRMLLAHEGIEDEQLSIFLGEKYLLTIQQHPGDCLDPVRQRLRTNRGKIRKRQSDYLCYAIIDAVIDAYFPIVDSRGEMLEDLDEAAPSRHTPQFMAGLHQIRGDLSALRRAIRPLRDALTRLMPDSNELFRQETQLYLRDCFDHTIQLMDLLDNYRDMCIDLRDYYLSSMDHRMNEIMKVLTIIATIFMPLSFVAGVYGMNFDTKLPGNMPELNIPYAYVGVLVLMATITAVQIGFFWKRGWLGSDGAAKVETKPKRHWD